MDASITALSKEGLLTGLNDRNKVGMREIEGSYGNEKDMRRVAKDFEAFFLTQTLQQMFSGISEDGIFSGGFGEKVYRNLMYQEYGKIMSERGGIGIAQEVYEEMLRLQQAAEGQRYDDLRVLRAGEVYSNSLDERRASLGKRYYGGIGTER